MNAPAVLQKSGLSAGEKTCWLLTVIGGGMVAVPICFGPQLESWNGGQYALGFAGLLVAFTAFVCTFLFRRRRKIGDGLLDERKLLAHWTYDVAEWRRFTEEDFGRERHEKWTLFGVLVGICVLVGGAFWVADPRGGGPAVAGILVGLCAFIAVVIAVTTRWQRRHRLEHRSEVRVPIPSGREDEAAGIVERFRARIGCA